MCQQPGKLSQLLLLSGLLLAVIAIHTPQVVAGDTASSAKKLVKTYVYKKVGSCEVKLDVHSLPGPYVRPAIMWIHGGALINGNRGSVRKSHFEAYLDAGFTVISIDYRLAPETKLPGIIADLKDAYRWIRKHAKKLHVDANHIAVVGHSAGGYLTLMSGFVHEPRPTCLVAFYGYGNILADWYAKPEPFYVKNFDAVTEAEAKAGIADREVADLTTLDKELLQKRRKLYLYTRQNGVWPKWVTTWNPETEAEKFTPYCPEKNVTKAFPPTLMLHGTKDTDVPYSQSVDMARALKTHGVEHELITMPNMGHGFDGSKANDPRVQQAFAKVLSFLRKHNMPK